MVKNDSRETYYIRNDVNELYNADTMYSTVHSLCPVAFD